MEKTDLYFIPINEVAKRLDIPAHTLRYWEKQFGGAIKTTTGSGGRRYYRPEVVEKLETIKSLLYDKVMTIAGVKKMIHNGEFSSPDVQTKPETISKKIDASEIDDAIDLLKQAYELL